MMDVTWKWWGVFGTIWASSVKMFERLPGAATPADGHGAVWSLGRRGELLFAIRHGHVSRAFALLQIDGLYF